MRHARPCRECTVASVNIMIVEADTSRTSHGTTTQLPYTWTTELRRQNCGSCKGSGKIGPVAPHPLEPGPRR